MTGSFFDDLARMIDYEAREVNPVARAVSLTFASIGIEKGKPFHPGTERGKLLDEAARFGSAIARANSFASDDEARIVYPDRKWEWAFIGGSASWDSQGYVNTVTGAPVLLILRSACLQRWLRSTSAPARNISGRPATPVENSSTAAATIGCGFRQISRSRISGPLWLTTLIAVRRSAQ